MMNLPNKITYSRFVLIPIMWTFALTGNKIALGIVLAIAGLTDALDGYIARRLGQVTIKGARLDSLSDHLVLISVIVFLFMLLPELYIENKILIIVSVTFVLIGVFLGYILYRRVVASRLISGKIMTIILYIFIIHAFIFGYSKEFLYVTAAVAIISSKERIIALIFKKNKEDIQSIFSK